MDDRHRAAGNSHAGWWIVAGLGVAILLLGLAGTTPWAARTAAVVAAGLAPERAPEPVGVRGGPPERLP